MTSPNPVFEPWSGPLGAPPFDRVEPHHFLPAARAAIAAHNAQIAEIRNNDAPPDFDNTIVALERAGETLSRVRRLFWTLSSAHASEPIRLIEGEMSMLLDAHDTDTRHDRGLFERVAAVHDARTSLGLKSAQLRLVESSYAGFVRGGAALDGQAQMRFAAIDARLAELSVVFGQNVLAATNGWSLTLDVDELDGIPETMRIAAAARAASVGVPGRFQFTLDRTDYEGFLTFSTRRDLRECLWRAFVERCDGGPYDNWPTIAEILALRHERADLLGYRDFASFQLAKSR